MSFAYFFLFHDRFDRGTWTNLLEFLKIPGYYVDYYSLYDLPAELTQENMRINSNRLNSIRLNNIHTAYSGQLHSGPPSVDLEMVVKHRADSIDSNDTSNPDAVDV